MRDDIIRLRGRIVPEHRGDPDLMDALGRVRGSGEVLLRPGRCVTWRCNIPVPPGVRECPAHAAEPLPVCRRNAKSREASARWQRERRVSDPEWAQRERDRKRADSRARRAANPELREKEARIKREKRLAQIGAAA